MRTRGKPSPLFARGVKLSGRGLDTRLFSLMAFPVLDGRQRRHLRALAHNKKPVVQVGNGGVTPGVVQALDQALLTHELVKVRVLGDADTDVAAMGEELGRATSAALAQNI